ncbi:MAG: hypothetical protein K2P93_06565 [Alphaproteobacteria bacterium]|nr:hypothetical protein [Alphaproteobacteria bacterium]
MTEEKHQKAQGTNEATFSLIDSKRKIKWVLFSTGVLGGMGGAIFINAILYVTPHSCPFREESASNKTPLDVASSNDWLATHLLINRVGSVDRDEIIHDYAQSLSNTNMSDKEFEDKLSSFVMLYDEVVKNVMAEKKVLLLERDAFATHTVSDFTEEVRQCLQQAQSQQTKDQS